MSKKGKLIIIESGSDASGKATQSEKLFNRLKYEGYNVRKVEFPNYKSDSSALVKMYLNGDFGKNPGDVDPYVASTFYAVDRYASYKTDWEQFYLGGGIIIADRYTTSNMVHQAAKITENDKNNFLDWLWNLEFNMYKLPIPECVVFLDMPPKWSEELMKGRENKITGGMEKDIHESNRDYLIESYNNAQYIAQKYNWDIINCANETGIRSVEDIHDEIYNLVLKGL
jgi:dTMP kinase